MPYNDEAGSGAPVPDLKAADGRTVLTRLEGIVVSGFGLARASFDPLHSVIEAKSGLTLERGTLNVKLGAPYIVVPDFVLEGREHGHHETLLLQRCRVMGVAGLILRTSTQASGGSHPLDVIEILATTRLRTSLGIEDGDRIVVEVARSL